VGRGKADCSKYFSGEGQGWLCKVFQWGRVRLIPQGISMGRGKADCARYFSGDGEGWLCKIFQWGRVRLIPQGISMGRGKVDYARYFSGEGWGWFLKVFQWGGITPILGWKKKHFRKRHFVNCMNKTGAVLSEWEREIFYFYIRSFIIPSLCLFICVFRANTLTCFPNHEDWVLSVLLTCVMSTPELHF